MKKVNYEAVLEDGLELMRIAERVISFAKEHLPEDDMDEDYDGSCYGEGTESKSDSGKKKAAILIALKKNKG